MKNARVKPENRGKHSTPRQIRRIAKLYCIPAMAKRRITRSEADDLIEKLERWAGKAAVSRLDARLGAETKARRLASASRVAT